MLPVASVPLRRSPPRVPPTPRRRASILPPQSGILALEPDDHTARPSTPSVRRTSGTPNWRSGKGRRVLLAADGGKRSKTLAKTSASTATAKSPSAKGVHGFGRSRPPPRESPCPKSQGTAGGVTSISANRKGNDEMFLPHGMRARGEAVVSSVLPSRVRKRQFGEQGASPGRQQPLPEQGDLAEKLSPDDLASIPDSRLGSAIEKIPAGIVRPRQRNRPRSAPLWGSNDTTCVEVTSTTRPSVTPRVRRKSTQSETLCSLRSNHRLSRET